MSFLMEGETAACETFRCESGGHRWQRIPPTERDGRVHTSTVTVAVLGCGPAISVHEIDMKDVRIDVSRGSGPGGQHRNKVNSCVTMLHRPTGITARVDGRDQHRNRQVAIEVLRARVLQYRTDKMTAAVAEIRRGQIGSGMRGDKVRTYRVRDNQMMDHVTGEKKRLSDWIKE